MIMNTSSQDFHYRDQEEFGHDIFIKEIWLNAALDIWKEKKKKRSFLKRKRKPCLLCQQIYTSLGIRIELKELCSYQNSKRRFHDIFSKSYFAWLVYHEQNRRTCTGKD